MTKINDVPDETLLPLSIQQVVRALEITSINTVRIYGRARDTFMPAWVQAFSLGGELSDMPLGAQKMGDRLAHPAVICLP